MDRLDAMHMFVRVVETSSFTKVAHEFATTQPTVTKQIAAMEARLKVRLLNRNTRGVSLTEAGALYYEKCKAIVNDVAEADKVVQVRQTQVQGQLRIGSSVAFGRRVLIPLALEFMAHNPRCRSTSASRIATPTWWPTASTWPCAWASWPTPAWAHARWA